MPRLANGYSVHFTIRKSGVHILIMPESDFCSPSYLEQGSLGQPAHLARKALGFYNSLALRCVNFTNKKNMGKTYLKEISPWKIITNLTGELILRDIFTESTVSIRKFNWGKIHNGELSDEILHFTMMCPARKYFGCFPK